MSEQNEHVVACPHCGHIITDLDALNWRDDTAEELCYECYEMLSFRRVWRPPVYSAKIVADAANVGGEG